MKKFNSMQLTTAVILSIFLTLSFSCKTPTAYPAEKTIRLSADTLKLAEIKMQSYIDAGKLSGISVLTLKNGETAHRATFGLAHIDENRAVEENTIFRIYSMSKSITAAALMMLYDEGKFQLDDPVEGYIPEFKETKVWEDGKEVDQNEPFTIRHLLTHTAGFSYGNDQDSHVDSLYNNVSGAGVRSKSTLEEMIKLLATLPLKYQPGTNYEYSFSIDVAGYLVEVLSGESFDQFLQTGLFDPLGMEDTGFEVPEEDWDRLAMIYTKDKDSGELIPVEYLTNAVKQKVTLFSGGGGLVSTIDDYGKFGQMLLNGGELNGARILKESTVKLIMSDQMPSGLTFEKRTDNGLGGSFMKETGEYSKRGMASTLFVVDPINHMVTLAFTQYIPFMGVPFAYEYEDLVRNSLME